MYCLKVIGEDLWNAKTPYIEEEFNNEFLTSNIKRRAEYKHLGVAKNRLRDLQSTCSKTL